MVCESQFIHFVFLSPPETVELKAQLVGKRASFSNDRSFVDLDSWVLGSRVLCVVRSQSLSTLLAINNKSKYDATLMTGRVVMTRK